MGIIKKILYRNNILEKSKYHHFFLDMEENIHIHYRDLRIELSRGEFEEFVGIFSKQSEELTAIIDKKQYEDGILANANQDDVRIWTTSKLHRDVTYHPQRLSLEECTDGYHLHFRNLKILMDEKEFRQIASLFRHLDIDSPYANCYEDVLKLLEANDIDFMLDVGNIPPEVLSIAVAKYHYSKAGAILKCVGFEAKGSNEYQGSHLKVVLRADVKHKVDNYKKIKAFSSTVRLVDYLCLGSRGIDCNEINHINCQVSDLYSSILAGKKLDVETDHQMWLYSRVNQQVIFPFSSTPLLGGKEAADAMHKMWWQQLQDFKLHFIKPTKIPFPKAHQSALHAKVLETIRTRVAAYAAVDRVFTMGSLVKGDMGEYLVPFVHGKTVKLGSDVDILVEINPQHEMDVPGHWRLMSETSPNKCAIYHAAEVPLDRDTKKWTDRFPNIKFVHHLIDAYVFFPSRGHVEEKDAFLAKFKAELLYDRKRDGVINPGGEEARVACDVSRLFGFSQPLVEAMNVPTENRLYKVFSEENKFILKLFKVSGNYKPNRIQDHVAYEVRLITQLKDRGVMTAGIVPSSNASEILIENLPALLFEYLPGKVQQRPEYELNKICHALADIHRVQQETPLELEGIFTFDATCIIWLSEFNKYSANTELGSGIAAIFENLKLIYETQCNGDFRGRLYGRSINIHNHGDVSPKNVILGEDGEAYFFDFNNAFFGSRMADILDGAFEFSLAENYSNLVDFARFDVFISLYEERNPLTQEERDDLPSWIELIGLIKFLKEIRMLIQRPESRSRTKRLHAIADFVLSRRMSR